MPKSIQGIYRHGEIELSEVPDDVPDETHVIVTFLAPRSAPVVEADNLQTGLPQLIVAMITSRLCGAWSLGVSRVFYTSCIRYSLGAGDEDQSYGTRRTHSQALA